MIRADARRFPCPRNWIERMTSRLCRRLLSEAYVRHNELSQALTRAQKTASMYEERMLSLASAKQQITEQLAVAHAQLRQLQAGDVEAPPEPGNAEDAPRPWCDHEFVGGTRCGKCGLEASVLRTELQAELNHQPHHLVRVRAPHESTQSSYRREFERAAERMAELKYRQLKQHVQHLKAELRDSTESSCYLECLELFDQIPQLRHIATRYLHEQDSRAIAADVEAVLDRVPWLREMVERDPAGIRLAGDPARDR